MKINPPPPSKVFSTDFEKLENRTLGKLGWTFISLIHSLIYSKFSGSLPHAGNSSILLRAHSKVKIINTNLRASMSDERLEHLIKVSIERDIANKIELDSLFELFETSGSWKLAL